MELEHKLAVDAPVDEVWQALVNPERVVGCMPGATLLGVEGDSFTGQIKVKMGPVALLYKGTGTFVDKDEDAHRLVMEANAKDTRGNGTAKSTITMTLTGEGEKTTGTVQTDLAITGKPAQFGRGMISDVGGKIIEQFAACLSTKLAPQPEVAEPATGQPETDGAGTAQATTPQPAQQAEALDLMEYAKGSMLQRVLPVVGAIVLGAVVFAIVRRLRRR
ncbi:MAG TPA: SRPBCC family protein [Aldersonia sp.]